MTQSQQLRKLAARSATAFLLAALCVFPLYIDKFSNLGVVKFTGICTLSWAFALWLGALACVGARPDQGRLPWKADPALWALGAVTASGVVSTVLSLSPGASFWGLGGYYGGCMMVLFTAAGYLAVRAFAPQKILLKHENQCDITAKSGKHKNQIDMSHKMFPCAKRNSEKTCQQNV